MAGSLHDHALQAEQHLEALATGLAKAGADPAAIQTVTKMASVTRKLISALGKGQEETGDKEPPADEEAPPEEDGPPQPQDGPPPPGDQQPHTLDSATAALHRDAQNAAQKRKPPSRY